MKLLTLALLALLSACESAPEPRESHYYVVRHLQKAEGRDPGLSEEGRRNAAMLADSLAAEAPAAIYVSSTRRARETAAPLAARLGLTVKEYDPRDTPGLVARVAAEPGSVLVVGHSNTVPDIVERLGGVRPADLSEQDYGDLWVIARNGGATVRRRLGE